MVIYVIDTSALIDLARWYPMDRQFFRPIWDKIEELISSNKMVAPYEVLREIDSRSDELSNWAHARRDMFIHPTADQIVFIGQIKNAYDDSYWEREANKTGPWADPWIVALALHYKKGSVVREDVKIVTQESKRKPNRIPQIASKFKIESLDVLEFLWEIGIR